MADLSTTSEPSSQQSSQCLPPLVDELQLHCIKDGENSDTSDSGSDKHPSVSGTTSVPNNEPKLSEVRRLRNGKTVVLSGNRRKLEPGYVEKQSSECNLSPLPCEDNYCARKQCHTGPTVSSKEKTNRRKQTSKKKSSKLVQPPDNGDVCLPRVTRSKAKLMGQNGEGDSEAIVLPTSSDAPQSSHNQTMDDAETHQKTLTSKAQIKYNKPTDCSCTARGANCQTSERRLLTSNNRDKKSIPVHNHGCVNGSRKQQHCSGFSCGEESQPLSDVTNSSCDDIFADGTRPSFIQSSSQTRVYQLVAGKKNKKPRKQQPRKTAMHVKKLSTTGDAENHPISDQESASSQGSAQNDHCLRQYHPRKASQHMKTSGEYGDTTAMACGSTTGVCDMFSKPLSTSGSGGLSHQRVFKSNEYESDSNFHTLFQDNSDIFI